MAKYKEAALGGEKWQRAARIVCQNPHSALPSVAFHEEELTVLADGREINNALGTLHGEMSDPATIFQLRNPTTYEAIPGATATYQDVYVLLLSLYYHLAEARDAAASSPPA